MAQNKEPRIPEATVQRLSIYLRCLEQYDREGQKIVSSHELAVCCGYKAAQIRKDLAYFGELGVRGVGYYIKDLIEDLKKILGLVDVWDVALVGAGNLGSALMSYKGFPDYGFRVRAVFDLHPDKVPAHLKKDHEIYHLGQIKEIVRQEKIRIAIVAVPAEGAQEVANILIDAGIKAILNFAPIKIHSKEGIKVRNVDLAVDLGVLTFFLTGRRRAS